MTPWSEKPGTPDAQSLFADQDQQRSLTMGVSDLPDDGLTGPALQRATEMAAEFDIAFSLADDFDELLTVNEANRESWDPLMPQFHPGFFNPETASSFWVKGVDSSRQVIAVRAYRRFDLPERLTLHDALLDLSFFYDDPAKAKPGERIEISAMMPRRVSGSFVFSGALWVHPSARRLGLPGLTKSIGRAVAHDRWDAPLQIAMVEDTRSTGERSKNMEKGVRWSGSYVAPECRFTLFWWTRDEIAQAVARFLNGSTSENSDDRPAIR